LLENVARPVLLAPAPAIDPVVLIRGAGEMASAIAWRLHQANIRRICMTELDRPLCVRRTVSFCDALESGETQVEGVAAVVIQSLAGMAQAWRHGKIAIAPQRRWRAIAGLSPDVVIDAILAKRNIATSISDAPLVVALGPGFSAGDDCHFVIETNRGHHLGRVIARGEAEPNTGIPGDIAGHTRARVLQAAAGGIFESERAIGDVVREGDIVGHVAGIAVVAATGGILRGLLASGTPVSRGVKLGDIDPRAKLDYCDTISDKARAIAGAALECVMRHCNRPAQMAAGANCGLIAEANCHDPL
jgi:xanthine dehydrogenase accessory factor